MSPTHADVVAVEHTVAVVVLEHDAVEHHLLAGGRRERYALVVPLLAGHLVDGNVGEQIARALVDVRGADRQVPGDLPLEVQRELVGVLVLQVVGDVERPRGIVVSVSTLIGVSPWTLRAASRVSSVSISPSPLVSTELHGPTWKICVRPFHERHVGTEPSQASRR